jgi:cytochrome c-type biogenesis protein CcmH
MRFTAFFYLAPLLAAASLMAQEPLAFDSIEQELRYQELTEELRCTVCQNQSLADSDAPLAQDLREEIYTMMTAGRSDEEIKAFLTERYGDFVLYRPPVQSNTVALWAIPVVLLLGGALVVFLVVSRRNRKLAARREEGGS